MLTNLGFPAPMSAASQRWSDRGRWVETNQAYPTSSPMADQHQLVRVTTQDSVAQISLNRASAKNALNEALRTELLIALHSAEQDPNVRCVLIKGEGRDFCAGADINELKARTALSAAWAPVRLDCVIESMTKPVVAALQGYTLGGGLELALACTIRLASSDFRGGFPEVKLGVFPGLGGTQRLPRIAGEARALELILTGRLIDADEALRIGLVSRVTSLDELPATAMKLARELSAGPPVAIRAIIEGVRRASDLSRSDGLDYERRLFGLVCATRDKEEGIQAWLEKRSPQFSGT